MGISDPISVHDYFAIAHNQLNQQNEMNEHDCFSDILVVSQCGSRSRIKNHIATVDILFPLTYLILLEEG